MAIPKMYALRREGGKLQVQVDGGWMNYTQASPQARARIDSHEHVQKFLVNPGLADPYIASDFEVDLMGAPDDDVSSPVDAPLFDWTDPKPGMSGETDTNNLYLTHGDGSLAPFSPVLATINKTISDVHAQLVAQQEVAFAGVQAMMEATQGGPGGTVPVIVKIKVSKETKTKEMSGLFHQQMPKLLAYMASGQHCYLPGGPGSGKSHAAKQACDALGWEFASMSMGPQTTESRFWGGQTVNGAFTETPFMRTLRYARDNPTKGAAFLADELDNGNGGVLATLNSTLANGWVTTPSGELITVGANWVLLAAANTYGTGPTAEFSGRNKLDAATLDRFVYVPWETDEGMETTLVRSILADAPNGAMLADAWLKSWRESRRKAKEGGLKVFITMRGAQNGAKLLRNGIAIRESWDAVLGNKLPSDQRAKVSPW